MIDSVLFGQEHIGSDVNLLTLHADKVNPPKNVSSQRLIIRTHCLKI